MGGNFFTEDSQLTLLFVPTSYGTVTPTAPAMALRQSAQASYEASTQDATRTETAATSTLLEQTQQLLSRVKASERMVASTSTSLEASKAENAELRRRVERLESLLTDAKVNRDMMTRQ